MVTDLSELPRGKDAGWAPDAAPRFLPVFAAAWKERVEGTWHKPIAAGTRLRLSKAGACARELGYFAQGLDETEPPTLADYWRLGLGTMIHDDIILPVLEAAFPGATIEHLVTLADRTDDLRHDLSGRIDLFVAQWQPPDPTAPPRRVVVELKSVNGFGFKMAIGARGPAEGPKPMHVRQLSIAGVELDADEGVLAYVSMENLSRRELERLGRPDPDGIIAFAAEWTISRELMAKAGRAEILRQQRVLELVDAGKLPPRVMPDIPHGARVVDPKRGAWTIESPAAADGGGAKVLESGTTWMCLYCRQQSRCIADGAS